MSKKRIRAVVITGAFAPADMGPQYVLPATADAYEQMVEQMAKAIRREDSLYEEWDMPTSLYYKSLSRAGLCAIGINPPKKCRP